MYSAQKCRQYLLGTLKRKCRCTFLAPGARTAPFIYLSDEEIAKELPSSILLCRSAVSLPPPLSLSHLLHHLPLSPAAPFCLIKSELLWSLKRNVSSSTSSHLLLCYLVSHFFDDGNSGTRLARITAAGAYTIPVIPRLFWKRALSVTFENGTIITRVIYSLPYNGASRIDDRIDFFLSLFLPFYWQPHFSQIDAAKKKNTR